MIQNLDNILAHINLISYFILKIHILFCVLLTGREVFDILVLAKFTVMLLRRHSLLKYIFALQLCSFFFAYVCLYTRT